MVYHTRIFNSISCLSKTDSMLIIPFAMFNDYFKFMIPFNYESIKVIENLKILCPFTYGIMDKQYKVIDLKYIVKNDYIMLQFIK